MTLESHHGTYEVATAALVAKAVSELTPGTGSFLILDDQNSHMRARVTDAGISIEYREAAREAPQMIEGQSIANALLYFTAYLASNGKWQPGSDWAVKSDALEGDEGGAAIDIAVAAGDGTTASVVDDIAARIATSVASSEATIGHPEMIRGYIAHFDQIEWWLKTFDADDQRLIFAVEAEKLAQHVEKSDQGWPTLVTGDEADCDRPEKGYGYFGRMALWLNRPPTRHLAQRFNMRALRLMHVEGITPLNILEAHHLLEMCIEMFYPDRDKVSGALDRAIWACQQMIAIAPRAAVAFQCQVRPMPHHKGFEQLVIIRDKQHRPADAIALCRRAKAQGWAGEWDSRIKRYEKHTAA